MKLVLLTITTFLVGVLATAAPTSAQRIDSPYRFQDHGQQLGLYAGHIAATEGVLRIGPQPAPTMGARWAMRVTGPLSIGAELGYTPTTRTVRDTVFIANDSLYREVGEANLRLLSLMGNLHFSIVGPRTWHGLQPFGLLGAGAVINLGGRTAVEDDLPATVRYDFGTSFAGQFGGGVDWFPSQRVSVRLDARNVLWRLSVPEAFVQTEAGNTLARTAWENNFALTAGLSFHF
ncbi:hypothetical protein BH23GEM9_BH23GEM9_35530 [soil metagenome]